VPRTYRQGWQLSPSHKDTGEYSVIITAGHHDIDMCLWMQLMCWWVCGGVQCLLSLWRHTTQPATYPDAVCPLAAAAVQGVCPTIRFHQYIIASTICIAHHRALSVFFGRSMPSLADLFSGGPVKNVGVAVYRFVSISM
jgi:hypothetical protein